MPVYLDTCLALKKEIEPTVLYIITNEGEVVQTLQEAMPELSTIVATNNRNLQKSLIEENVRVKKISERSLSGLSLLNQSSDILLGAFIEGMIGTEDRVLCLIKGIVTAVAYFEVKDLVIVHLKEDLANSIDSRLLEALLNLSFEIAREGREGRPTGALFVVGDSEKVLKYSRQLIINPFKGHSEEERNILNTENWETIKEFSLLDGAFVVNEQGVAISTGRYVGISWDIYLQGGLGGRHLAAASISKLTKAIAISVSSSGVIRIFKDGKEIFKVSTV